MLIKTIKMETHDDSLFSKAAPLLTAASELAYHTVNCSALNAEELRRENGIEVCIVHLYPTVSPLSLMHLVVSLRFKSCCTRQHRDFVSYLTSIPHATSQLAVQQ